MALTLDENGLPITDVEVILDDTGDSITLFRPTRTGGASIQALGGGPSNARVYIATSKDRESILEQTARELAASDWGAPPTVLYHDRMRLSFDEISALWYKGIEDAYEAGHEWVLFLEDDVTVNRHLRHNLARWAPAAEGWADVGVLYTPNLVGDEPFVETNPERGYRVAEVKPDAEWPRRSIWGSQAMLFSRKMVGLLHENWNRFRGAPDLRTFGVATMTGTRIVYTLPDLVQHRPGRTAYGTPPHRSRTFRPDWKAPDEGPWNYDTGAAYPVAVHPVAAQPLAPIPADDPDAPPPAPPAAGPARVRLEDMRRHVEPPTSDRCVLTLAAGPTGRDMLGVSWPSLEAYARKCGADFRVITPPDGAVYPLAWKFLIGHYLTLYKRLAFVDADVVIRAAAPVVFDAVPETHLGMHNELAEYGRSGHRYAWLFQQWEDLQVSQGVPLFAPSRYYNTGVIVGSAAHAPAFEPPPGPFAPHHCAEQSWVNIQVVRKEVPTVELAREFNTQFWVWEDTPEWEAAYFWHFSGVRDHELRMRLMREHAARADAPIGGRR